MLKTVKEQVDLSRSLYVGSFVSQNGWQDNKSGRTIILMPRDHTRSFKAIIGDKLMIELDELPLKDLTWHVMCLPDGLELQDTCYVDGYSNRYLDDWIGKRLSKEGKEKMPKERRFFLPITEDTQDGVLCFALMDKDCKVQDLFELHLTVSCTRE